MRIWIDAQLSPSLALWIQQVFAVEAVAVKDLGLRDASDLQIFERARKEGVIIITKDSDFFDLIKERGVPPKLIWITCGNTSNETLKRILQSTMGEALRMLAAGEDVVEIRDV